MKLHLPKQLFTALLTAITLAAAPVWGLTLTDGYHKTYSLSEGWEYTDSSGQKVSYDAATGILSNYNMDSKTLSINLNTSWNQAGTVIAINPGENINHLGSNSVGLYAQTDGSLSDIAGTGIDWNGKNITASRLLEEGAQTTLTVKSQKANSFGTYITAADGDQLYFEAGLRYGNGEYKKTYLNSSIISAIVVTDIESGTTVDGTKYYASNFAGTWEKQFSKDSTEAVLSLTKITAETRPAQKTAIVVGNVGQLWLDAEAASLSLAEDTDIYIGNTSYQDSDNNYNLSAIRFGNTDNSITVNGNIFLVDSASMIATATGAGTITVNGTVTDKVRNSAGKTVSTGSTLSLKGTGYNFTGAVDVTGLHLAEGAKLIIAAGATMELAHTITGTGTLTLNGTLNLTDISLLSDYSASYSDGDSGFCRSKTAQLTQGTLVQGGGASITVSGMGANDIVSFDDKTGYLTVTYAASGTYYVNDSREYNSAASMGTATNLNISSTGTLTIGLSDVGTKPISNSGKLNIAAGTENVTLDTLLSEDKAITQTATGITSITTTGSVSTSSAIAHTTGTLKIQGESGTSKATLSSTHGWTVGSLELENITATLESSGQQQLKLTNLTLNAGATLNITGDSDFVCYGNDITSTWTVNEGAVLWIGTTSAAARQTLSRNFGLVLAGGEVNGKSDGNGTLDYYNNNQTNSETAGTIQVTKNSTLNAAVRARGGVVNFQIDGSNTVLTMGNATAGVENYAALTGSGSFEKTGTGTLLYKGSAFSNALAINAGIFEYNTGEERTHTAAISGSGTFKKSGSGTLTLSGALGTDASSRLGNVTAVGGELKLTGTGYVSTLEISGDADVRVATGGNLDVTTFNASALSVNTNRNVYIENGATVTAGQFKVAYNMGTVEVDGTLNANTELYLGTNNDDNVVDLLSGTGVINAAKLRAGNHGSYGIDVATLNIGAGGLVVESTAVLNLASTTTTVAGATTVNSGNMLNFNGGSATLNGAVTNSGSFNVNGASVTLNGGVSGTGTVGLTGGTLTLAAGQTNEIALFNYSGGTLNHSGLTVTDATFSGITLDNTANNGTLQLNGTLNVTSTNQLTSDGTGSYVGGAVKGNGFLNTTYLLIQGGSIGYGNDFTVTLGGSAVEAVKDTGSLKITLQGQGDFYVNSGVESISTASSALGYRVASGAELIVDTEKSMHALLSGGVTAIGGAADAKLTISQSGLNTYDGTGGAAADYSLKSTFAGILELGEDVIFTLGRGDGTDRTANYTQDAVVDLSSLAGLVLRNGAELWYNADGTTTIANVSVSANDEATIYYKDSKSANQVQLTGKTQLHGTLNLTTKHDGGIDIKNLVGNGTLDSSGTDVFYTTISSLQYTEGDEISTFTGSLSFDGASNNVEVSTGTGADISLTSLSATDVSAFTLYVQDDTTVGSLTLTGGNNTISVDADKTLKVTEHLSGLAAGSVTLNAGSYLDLTSFDLKKYFEMANAAVTGAGTVKYASKTDIVSDNDSNRFSTGATGLTLNNAIEISGDVAINSWVKDSSAIVISTLNNNLTVNGELRLENRAKLDVVSGTLNASTINLGHAIAKNYGHLQISGGEVITGALGKTTASDNGNTLTMSGGSLEITSDAGVASGIQTVITGGTLKASGDVSWGITGASIGGATIETGTGAVTLHGGTLTGLLTNDNGSLVLSGAFDVTSAGYATTTEAQNISSNGFASSTTTYTLVSSASNLEVGDDVSWTIDGAAASGNDTLSYAGGSLLHTVEGTEYYVLNTTALKDISKTNSKGEALTAVVLNGGGLNMNDALGEGVKLKVQKTGTTVVDIASGQTLNVSQVENTKATRIALHGSGTLNFGAVENAFDTDNNNHKYINGNGEANRFFDASKPDWTGTVVINGARSGEKDKNLCLNLNLLGNAGSKVELINTAGWFSNDSNNPLNTSLILSQVEDNAEPAAWTITNGSSQYSANSDKIMATFAGAVSGKGTMKFVWSQSNIATTGFVFTGDVSGWTGWFDMAATDYRNYFNLQFEGNANNIAVNVKETPYNKNGDRSHVHVRIDDEGSTAVDKTINVGGQIDASYMTLGKSTDTASNRATVKLNNNVTLSDTLTNYANTTVATGKTLTANTVSNAGQIKLGEVATITGKQDSAATMSKVQMSSTGISGTATDGTSSISAAEIEVLAADATFTIADMTLTNTSITVAETTTRVNLSNVSVAAGSAATLAKGAFAMQNQATVGTGGGEVDFTTSSYSGFTLGSAESAASITLNLGDLSQVKPMGPGVYESITILLEDFHMTEGNASIFFAADSWLGQLLSSQGANAYVSGSLDAPESVSEGGSGSSVSVSYNAATGSNVGTIITITGLNVPEPTTSTLSLLALAALAARRRRK